MGIIEGLLGLPAAIYYSIRLKSRREEGKHKRRDANIKVRSVVTDAISMVKDYASIDEGQFQKLIDNVPISKKLRRELYKLKRIAEQYKIWRGEAWEIVHDKVVIEQLFFKEVDESLKQVSEGISGVFNKEHTPDIYKAIYQGNLTPELAKESLLKYRRDSTVKFKDSATGEERERPFRDVVEGEQFNSFVNSLIQLHNRESIKMLREMHARFIDRTEAILNEVS